jgi:hypothetical protein
MLSNENIILLVVFLVILIVIILIAKQKLQNSKGKGYGEYHVVSCDKSKLRVIPSIPYMGQRMVQIVEINDRLYFKIGNELCSVKKSHYNTTQDSNISKIKCFPVNIFPVGNYIGATSYTKIYIYNVNDDNVFVMISEYEIPDKYRSNQIVTRDGIILSDHKEKELIWLTYDTEFKFFKCKDIPYSMIFPIKLKANFDGVVEKSIFYVKGLYNEQLLLHNEFAGFAVVDITDIDNKDLIVEFIPENRFPVFDYYPHQDNYIHLSVAFSD